MSGEEFSSKPIIESDKYVAVPVICITLPSAKDVTIKSSKLLSTFLMVSLIERTLNNIIETTPNRDATTNGKISNAPKRITVRKIYKDLLARSF